MLFLGVFLLMQISPYQFGYDSLKSGQILLIQLGLLTIALPAFGILLMKQLGLIKSLEMEDRMERIGPLILVIIFYLWLAINAYKNQGIPPLGLSFIFGCIISLIIAFIINIFSKISLHMVGISGIFTLIVTLLFFGVWGFQAFGTLIYLNDTLAVVLIIMGMVASARLILDRHTFGDIYGGILVGIIGQVIAWKLFL